jgi:hypothetical protein
MYTDNSDVLDLRSDALDLRKVTQLHASMLVIATVAAVKSLHPDQIWFINAF